LRKFGLVLAGLLALAVAPSTSRASAVVTDGFHSQALEGTLHFDVYLPAGYAAHPQQRYPVVYFLHGLPATADGYHEAGWLGAATQAEARQAILVAPQGASDRDDDDEYLDLGAGRNWETAISEELPAYVDAHYRTIANRGGRALVGLSAGGYGAADVGLHHLPTFSVVESWSGYFHPTDPSGLHTRDLGSAQANARANLHKAVPRLRQTFVQHPTFLAFYVGSADGRFAAENVEMDRELASARVPHLFRVYAGGHSKTLWQAHAHLWLALALAHLSQG
jgi:enterochelin esterase-like enzyme